MHNLVTDQRSIALTEVTETSRARTHAAAEALRSAPENQRAWVEWARSLIDQRMASEAIVAADENFFRIGWNGPKHLLTLQILGRDELTLPLAAVDDLSSALYYTASYASWYPSEGLPRVATARVLARNLAVVGQTRTKHVPASAATGGSGSGEGEAGDTRGAVGLVHPEQVSYTSQHGLEGAIDRRTYRIRFETGQDDVMVRHRPPAELNARACGLRANRARKEAMLTAWLSRRHGTISPPEPPQQDDRGIERESAHPPASNGDVDAMDVDDP